MNVLLVGLGSIGKKHVDALEMVRPESTIYALRTSKKASTYKDVLNVFDVPSDVPFDFALIANPTHEHLNTIERLLPYGIPLFIEKPVMMNVHKLTEKHILENISAIPTYVACNLRFLECLIVAKSWIDSQKLGRVNEVNVYCGSYLPEWRKGQDYQQSYSATASKGGGVHLDLIHEIDYLQWIFGQPNMVQSTFTSNSSIDIDSYDYANYCFTYTTFSANVVLNYYRKDYKRQLEVVGEKGTLLADLGKNSVQLNGELTFSSQQGILDTYQKQMAYFLNCIEHGNPTFNDFQEGLNVLKLAYGETERNGEVRK